jgi:ADP-ribose pyrophosphatase
MFEGFFKVSKINFRHRLFGGGWSKLIQREVFQRGEAVGVLLYDPKNHLVGLVEQIRIGALSEVHGPWQFEVVAGMIPPGKTPEQVASSELQEEAGLSVDQLIPICDYLVSAGGTDEKMHMYCGLVNLAGREGIFGLEHENEDIMLHVWTYDEAFAALREGLLNSAAVTIGLQWLQLNYKNL